MADELGTKPASTRHELGMSPAEGRQARGVSLQEAALQLDVSERTVRRLIREGSVQAYKQKAARGFVWRVVLDHRRADEPGTEARQDGAQPGTSPAHIDEPTSTPPAAPELLKALEIIEQVRRESREELDQLRRENRELTAAASHWQARYQEAERRASHAEEQVRLLMAPKDEPEPEPPVEPVRVSWWKRLWG